MLNKRDPSPLYEHGLTSRWLYVGGALLLAAAVAATIDAPLAKWLAAGFPDYGADGESTLSVPGR